jgi:hypothetical protein
MFPNDLTPEKEFCATSVETKKLLNEAGAHVQAVLRSQFNFTESKYLKNIIIDFEDLPEYVIQRGIIWRFEGQRFSIESDYIDWQNKLISFFKTIPAQYVIKALQKGIEYAKKAYQYHLNNECARPENCILNQSWERRIAMAEQMLESIMPKTINDESESDDVSVRNRDFTTARQVLVLHYLLKEQGLNPIDNPTAVARLVQFFNWSRIKFKSNSRYNHL